jgi:hypothetical protein
VAAQPTKSKWDRISQKQLLLLLPSPKLAKCREKEEAVPPAGLSLPAIFPN